MDLFDEGTIPNVERTSLVSAIWNDIEDIFAILVHCKSPSFFRHEGDYRRFIEEAQFPLRTIFLWVWMLCNGGIGKHSTIPQ